MAFCSPSTRSPQSTFSRQTTVNSTAPFRLSPQLAMAWCLLGAVLAPGAGRAQSPGSEGQPERQTEAVGRADEPGTAATATPTVDAPAITPSTATPAASGETLIPGSPPESRLLADKLTKEGDVYIAEGNPVRFVSPDMRVTAKVIRIDAVKLTIEAEGEVVIERDAEVERRELMPKSIASRRKLVKTTESLKGSNFQYNYTTGQGKLDGATVRFAGFSVTTVSLIIEGRRYTAHNVILRPGGLTDEELKIYGEPPFNLRAREVVVNTGTPNARSTVKGAALYYKNTRLFPVPSYVLRSGGGFGGREDKAFQLSPRISYNSTDGALLTTSLRFALSRSQPERYGLTTDLGISTRIGFRGGVTADAETKVGTFALRARLSDIVTTQLTNRIELNRAPEIEYTSALFPLMPLPGKRRAGFVVWAGAGRYEERTIGSNAASVNSTRVQGAISITTRYNEVDGPYAEVFARTASYSSTNSSYRNVGFEVGYFGSLSRYIRGQVSYRTTAISGSTPFTFDRIEIAKEVRTTFDILPTRRFIIPIDLRYDLDLKKFRDERIGLLRSYGTFAYGITYQTARRELKLELRRGF